MLLACWSCRSNREKTLFALRAGLASSDEPKVGLWRLPAHVLFPARFVCPYDKDTPSIEQSRVRISLAGPVGPSTGHTERDEICSRCALRQID